MMISRLLRGRGQRDRDPAERHRQEARLKTILIFIILPRNFRGEPTANSHRPGLDGPTAPRRLWQPFPVSQEVNERERRRGGGFGGGGGGDLGGLEGSGRQARLQSHELCDHNHHCPPWPHPLGLAVAAQWHKQRVGGGWRSSGIHVGMALEF